MSLPIAVALLLWANRNHWFFGDEWDFILRRGIRGSELGLLQPHNEHWSTVPILVWRALVGTFGLSSYLPYAATLACLVAAAMHLSWRLAREGGADPWIAGAVVLVPALHGVAYQNLLFAFQIGFLSSLVFGTAYVLFALRSGALPLIASAVFGVLALASSGVGVSLIAAGTAAAFLQRGLRAAAETVALPASVFTAWYEAYGKHAARQAPKPSAEDVVAFVVHALADPWTQALGTALGVGALMTTGAWLVVRAREHAGRPIIGACLAGTAVQVLLAAYGRAALGPGQAGASRYSHLSLFLLAPVIALALTDGIHSLTGVASLTPDGAAGGIAVTLLLLVVAPGYHQLTRHAHETAASEKAPQDQVRAAASWLRSGDRHVLRQQPEPRYQPDIFIGPLLALVRTGAFSPGASDTGALLSARGALQTTTSPAVGAAPIGTAQLTAAAGVVLGQADAAGCRQASVTAASAHLEVIAQNARLRLSGPEAQFSIYLIDPENGLASTTPMTYTESGAFDLTMVADGLVAKIFLPIGWKGQVCGLRRN
jgi:hypothetical protein